VVSVDSTERHKKERILVPSDTLRRSTRQQRSRAMADYPLPESQGWAIPQRSPRPPHPARNPWEMSVGRWTTALPTDSHGPARSSVLVSCPQSHNVLSSASQNLLS
jgi:hypothetical protein